jgi:hypothetical protein
MPDHACLYISDPSLLGSKLFDSVASIKHYEGLGAEDQATGIRFDIEVARIQVNFMPAHEIAQHLEGFAGYVRSIWQGDQDGLLYVLSRIHQVRFVLGCVIEPGFDGPGRVRRFLGELNRRLNGLLLLHDSVIDYDGEPLVGPLCDQEGVA